MKVHEISPFTPGPLRAERAESNYANEDNYHVVSCQSDDVLGEVSIDTSPNPFHNGLANARLYAASPDLFAGIETALFWAFVSEDDAKFSPLYRAYFKGLRGDYPTLDISNFLRMDYFLMICGSIESTRWPERRQVTTKEFEEFGRWYEAPFLNAAARGWCLIECDYIDDEGDSFIRVMVPAFYDDGFNLTVGGISALYGWMKMPQLEDVFQSALWREVQRGSTENDEEEEETNDEC